MTDYHTELIPTDTSLGVLGLGRSRWTRRVYNASKRSFDIIISIAAAPLAIPIIAVAALLIRLQGGQAFYKQMRVGKDGKLFQLWKLRTMHPDAHNLLEEYLQANPAARAEWNKTQKLRNDPRITRIGSILRKYSIDELPQLLNVLLGQMSLVGPRPIMPEQRRQYPGTSYFSMRPGLTGLWQVSERNACTFAERAMHDNRYASMMSFGTDLRILMKTLVVVLRGTGL